MVKNPVVFGCQVLFRFPSVHGRRKPWRKATFQAATPVPRTPSWRLWPPRSSSAADIHDTTKKTSAVRARAWTWVWQCRRKPVAPLRQRPGLLAHGCLAQWHFHLWPGEKCRETARLSTTPGIGMSAIGSACRWKRRGAVQHWPSSSIWPSCQEQCGVSFYSVRLALLEVFCWACCSRRFFFSGPRE